MKRLLTPFLFCALSFALSACTKSSSSSDNSGPSNSAGGGTQIRSECGVVVDGKLENPVEASKGVFVSLGDILSNNLLVINREFGPQLVKLHGIGNDLPQYKIQAGINMLVNFPNAALFIPESEDCSASFPGGGTGAVGQLFTPQGQSFGEALLKAGFASVDSNDVCSGNLLNSCYSSLSSVDAPQLSYEDAGDLLWKPVSDKDGNLVVHVGRYGVKVVANGVEGADAGSGNGYGSTARFSRSGCSFGKNVRVEIFDRQSGAPLGVQGKHPYIVPDGCQRVQTRP